MRVEQAAPSAEDAFSPVTVVCERPEDVLVLRSAVFAGMRTLPNGGAVPNMGAACDDAWVLDVLFGRLCDVRMPSQYKVPVGTPAQSF